ncbi:glycoside hydrolase family 3 C-terminal domain-containing protein [Halobacterium noricense]|uniref:glycoside hydrolase family 3 C-terminal domain-containing protein n=1 Tax=Halobacterium noricense TaxID=223182 RepID=UPI001E5BDEB4|nr:glycoside hydrolase family 3 C-terminal domain-containing protein [Halobacterium noricense]UHH26794.1 glycoside hydrolase family 3 C-terminal domain-containing protein [Halobacterium noricense]
MPSGTYFGDALADAVEADRVNETTVVDDMVQRGLHSQQQTGALAGEQAGSDPARGTDEHYQTAQHVAEEGTVLLKNDDLLPLDADSLDELALVGPNVESFKPSVGGSDHIDAIRRISPADGIREVAGDVTVTTVATDPRELVGPDAFTPASGNGAGLTAKYYPNADWSGSPTRTRVEDNVALTEDDLSGIDAENVSVRWTGTVTPSESGTYALALTSQAPSRLYVDGEEVVTNEGGGFMGPKTEEYTLELEAGQSHEIRVDAVGTPPVNLEWTPPAAVQEAADAAASADTAIVLAKTDTFYGDDRHEFALPGNQNAVISAVADANADTAVVSNAESPVAMPWLAAVTAVLQLWFPGQEGGRALANVLFGETNPSGKTPVTFAESLGDYLPQAVDSLPNGARGYPGIDGTAYYDEGVFVGYRHFDEHDIEPLFPFGHGESYTAFEYENASVSRAATTPVDGLTVSVDVTNTGDRDGAEAVQVYVGAVDPSVERPPKELAGIAKTDVAAGETETVSVKLDREAFRYWDDEADEWAVDYGEYDVSVAASSRDVRATERIELRESVQQSESTTSGTGTQSETATASGSTGGNAPGFGAAAAAVAFTAGVVQRFRDDD